MRAPLHHADIGIHHVHELHVYGFINYLRAYYLPSELFEYCNLLFKNTIAINPLP